MAYEDLQVLGFTHFSTLVLIRAWSRDSVPNPNVCVVGGQGPHTNKLPDTSWVSYNSAQL